MSFKTKWEIICIIYINIFMIWVAFNSQSDNEQKNKERACKGQGIGIDVHLRRILIVNRHFLVL